MSDRRQMRRITEALALTAIAFMSSSCSALPDRTISILPPPESATASISIQIPPITEREIARSVADGEPIQVASMSVRVDDPDVEYEVEAACTASETTSSVAYLLSIDGDRIGAGTIACDGTLYRNTGLTGTGRGVRVILDDLPPGVTRAFARLVEAAR